MYKIAKAQLPELFRIIAAHAELYLPENIHGQVNFAAWEEEAEVDLDTLKTVKSPKDIFFPQSENLYTVRREGKKLQVEPEALKEQPFVVFGMRSCDLKGLEVLDRVFLADPVDTFYAARRAHGAIVALACHEPEETCFCRVFGVDPTEPGMAAAGRSGSGEAEALEEGDSSGRSAAADVAAWMIGEEVYWQPLTDKGLELTKFAEPLFKVIEGHDIGIPQASGAENENAVQPGASRSTAGTSDWERLSAEKENIRRIIDLLPYSRLSLEGWDGDALTEKFNSPLWEELYKPCLACGTCTFVCPTCQCYDIKDFDTGHGVQRYRCWDSCMYSDFTMMAHGNNRTSQMQRFRQRFMHKLVYFPANNEGMYSCVGCGRCVEKCPASLNIVKVIKQFAEASEGNPSKGEGGER